MLKFTSWPKPPLSKNLNCPEIPNEFIVFGLKYIVVNGNPQLEMPFKPLDRNYMENCISKSLSLFAKTLRTREGSILNEIRDLHVHMNEEINKAKAYEKSEMIILAKNQKVKEKNLILSSIHQQL